MLASEVKKLQKVISSLDSQANQRSQQSIFLSFFIGTIYERFNFDEINLTSLIQELQDVPQTSQDFNRENFFQEMYERLLYGEEEYPLEYIRKMKNLHQIHEYKQSIFEKSEGIKDEEHARLSAEQLNNQNNLQDQQIDVKLNPSNLVAVEVFEEIKIDRRIKEDDNEDSYYFNIPTKVATKLPRINKVDEQMEEEEGEWNCEICLEKMEGDIWSLECGHIYHRRCIKEYLNTQIKSRIIPIKCPNYLCSKELTLLDIKEMLNSEELIIFEQLSLHQYIQENPNEVTCCPTPDCPYAFILENQQTQFNCPCCLIHYCLSCKTLFHEGQTCKEYQVSNNFSNEDKLFDEYVKGQKFKQCTKCKIWVEKNQGCDHMKCRCNYQFCYLCGGPYLSCDCKVQLANHYLHNWSFNVFNNNIHNNYNFNNNINNNNNNNNNNRSNNNNMNNNYNNQLELNSRNNSSLNNNISSNIDYFYMKGNEATSNTNTNNQQSNRNTNANRNSFSLQQSHYVSSYLPRDFNPFNNYRNYFNENISSMFNQYKNNSNNNHLNQNSNNNYNSNSNNNYNDNSNNNNNYNYNSLNSYNSNNNSVNNNQKNSTDNFSQAQQSTNFSNKYNSSEQNSINSSNNIFNINRTNNNQTSKRNNVDGINPFIGSNNIPQQQQNFNNIQVCNNALQTNRNSNSKNQNNNSNKEVINDLNNSNLNKNQVSIEELCLIQPQQNITSSKRNTISNNTSNRAEQNNIFNNTNNTQNNTNNLNIFNRNNAFDISNNRQQQQQHNANVMTNIINNNDSSDSIFSFYNFTSLNQFNQNQSQNNNNDKFLLQINNNNKPTSNQSENQSNPQ